VEVYTWHTECACTICRCFPSTDARARTGPITALHYIMKRGQVGGGLQNKVSRAGGSHDSLLALPSTAFYNEWVMGFLGFTSAACGSGWLALPGVGPAA